MSYTRPPFDSADATWQGAASYTRPAFDSADATFEQGASASATIPVTGTATGAHGVAGTAAQTIAITGTAIGVYGVVFITGTASASIPVTGAASAIHAIGGSASASIPVTGSATGEYTEPFWGPASATIPIAASASGYALVSGSAAANLGISATASGVRGVTASAAASLSISASASAVHDWTLSLDPVTTQTYYALEIDDGILPAIRIPISSWQATLRLDVSSYVQAVIPAAGQWADQIAARPTAELIIYRGARFEGGLSNESEMARAGIQTLQRDQGPTNDTITLSGYARLFSSDTPPTDSITASRQLSAIRSISSGTSYRVRCGVDWYLKPGATAVIDESRQFTAGWINYYANTSDQWMEVGSG
jgi:hypothetical protein